MVTDSGKRKSDETEKFFKRHQYVIPFGDDILGKNSIEIIAYLKEKTIIFDGISDEVLEQIESLSEVLHYNPGDKILLQGSSNDRVFFLINGAVEFFKDGEFVLKLQRKGDIFGEMSLISKKDCNATIIAEIEVTLFSIRLKKVSENAILDSGLLEDTLYRFFAVILADKLEITTFKAIGLGRQVKERTEDLNRKNEELNIAINKVEEANRLKSEFLLNMSHELRTPMHGILSYSKFGIENLKKINKDKILYYFKQIKSAGERLMILLNNLLDLSQLEDGKSDYKMEETPVIQLVRDAVSSIDSDQKTRQMEIVVEEPEVSTIVKCDKQKIDQVVRNLLSNSLKFTPEEKRIIISFDSGKTPEGKRTTDKKMIPALKVSFVDEGVGIPENELLLVFDKFFQSSKTKTGAGGTGLGLAISKEIIKAHNGLIWAKNNPKEGVKVSFLLPYN